jgi:hypothetical protein
MPPLSQRAVTDCPAGSAGIIDLSQARNAGTPNCQASAVLVHERVLGPMQARCFSGSERTRRQGRNSTPIKRRNAMLRYALIVLAALVLVGATLVPDDAFARGGARAGGARAGGFHGGAYRGGAVHAGRVGGGRYAGGRYAHVSRPIARPGVGYGGRYAGYGGRYGYGYRPWGGVAAGAAVGAAAAGAYGAYGYYNNNYYNNGCYQNNYGNWICPNQHQY